MHNIYANFKYKLTNEKFLCLISEMIKSMLHYFTSADVTLERLYHISYLVHRVVLPQKCWIHFLRWVGVYFNFHQSFRVFSVNTIEKKTFCLGFNSDTEFKTCVYLTYLVLLASEIKKIYQSSNPASSKVFQYSFKDKKIHTSESGSFESLIFPDKKNS